MKCFFCFTNSSAARYTFLMTLSQEKSIKYLFGVVLLGVAIFFGRGYKEKVIVPETFSTPPPPGMYRVMKVYDGDTIEVSATGKADDIEKVRFIGIDTPETVDPRKPVQCFGKEASDHTKALLSGKDVELLRDDTQDNKDKYGRLLRYVVIGGVNINQVLIQEGYAYEYTYKIPYQQQRVFKAAQIYAREHKKGLWADGMCVGVDKRAK